MHSWSAINGIQTFRPRGAASASRLDVLRASSHEPAGSLTGTNFILGSYEKFQPGFRDEKRSNMSCGAKFEKQSKHSETQNYNFTPIIALATLIAESLQLNGMLMIWKIQQTMQDDAEFIRRVHMAKFPARLPRSRLEKPRSREPSQPTLSYEHIENFTKNSEVRRDLGNRASPVNRPGSYEEALT